MDVPAEATAHAAASGGNLLAPDVTMVILTWVTFFTLLGILTKFAWKPILENLKKREDYIRQSLKDADAIKAELAQLEASKVQILNDAKQQAAQIIDDARKTGRDLAHDIETKAKANAQEILTSSNAQIEGELQRVRRELKKESVDTAIALAGKILKENNDTDKNRRLVEEVVEKL